MDLSETATDTISAPSIDSDSGVTAAVLIPSLSSAHPVSGVTGTVSALSLISSHVTTSSIPPSALHPPYTSVSITVAENSSTHEDLGRCMGSISVHLYTFYTYMCTLCPYARINNMYTCMYVLT